MDAFLTQDERRAIQRLFEKWNKHAQPDVLMPMFYSRGFLTERDKAEFSAKPTSFDKNEFLFDNMLMRATYDQVCQVKKVLTDSGVRAHVELASRLPVRQPKPEPQANPAADPDRRFYSEQTNSPFGQQNTGPNRQQQFNQPQTGNQYQRQPSHDSQTNQPPPQPQNNTTPNQQPFYSAPNQQPFNATPNQQQNQPGQNQQQNNSEPRRELHQEREEEQPMDEDMPERERDRQKYNYASKEIPHNLERPGTVKTEKTETKPPESKTEQTNQSEHMSQDVPPTSSRDQEIDGKTSKESKRPDHEPFLSSRYGVKTEAYKQHIPHTETPEPPGGVHGVVPDPAPDTRTLPQDRHELGDNQNMLRLKAYGKKSNGQGLCVILANFTEDLKGYLNDIRSISEFFGNTLQYKVFGADKSKNERNYRNLTSEEFKVKLRELQDYLNEQNKNVDKLFVFVLSHGDEFGIKMCPPDKMDNSVRDRIKTETIVDMFTHNNVPALKGLPKCFFIQVCRGTEVIKAANKAAADKYDDAMETEELEFEKPRVVAVGADTLVCHAAKEGNYSWVADSKADKLGGSWFLQATIDVFQKYHKQEHVLDMMTEVNDLISTRKGRARIRLQGDTRDSSVMAYQLPAISNSLTRKLYLA